MAVSQAEQHAAFSKNNIMRYFLTLCLFFTSASFLQAQLLEDALYLSNVGVGGTARSLAVGNSMGAIGGDLSVMSSNPASLSVDYHSEILFSPQLILANTRSSLLSGGFEQRANRNAFNIANTGLLIGSKTGNPEGWRSLAFGMSFSRIADFNTRFTYGGTTEGSIIPTFVSNANQVGLPIDDLNPFRELLAFDTYLIDYNTSSQQYVGALLDNNTVTRQQTMQRSGGIQELGFSFSGNYASNLHIGGTVGIDFMRMNETSLYEEVEPTGSIDFERLSYRQDRSLRGTGFNLKLGALYRARIKNTDFRIGGAIHTPTFYRYNELYDTRMSGRVTFNNRLIDTTALSPIGDYTQRFRTPWRFMLNAGAVMGSATSKVKGFVGADAEYCNFRTGLFSPTNFDINNPGTVDYINSLNTDLTNLYRDVLSLRLGGEVQLESIRLRGGYQFRSSPYESSIDGVSDVEQVISGGIGFKSETFFFDLTYAHRLSEIFHVPYSFTTSPDVNVPQGLAQQQKGQIMMAVGIEF